MQDTYTPKPWAKHVLKIEGVLGIINNNVTMVILFGIIAAMFIQVLSRFVLKISVPWTEELSRYLWISITYLGMGVALSQGTHVEISLIASVIGGSKNEGIRRPAAKAVDIARYAFLIVFSSYLISLTWPYMLKVMSIGQWSSALHLPMWILDGVLLLGLFSLLVHSVFRLILSIGDHDAIIDSVSLGKGVES